LLDTFSNSYDQIHRLKSGNNDRNTVSAHKRLIWRAANNRANVARCKKSLHLVVWTVDNRLHRRLDANVGDQKAKIRQIQLMSLEHGQCSGRSGGLKTHGEEHNLPIQVVPRNLYGIERRINRSDRAAKRSSVLQRSPGTRHAKHIPEAGNYYVVLSRQLASKVNRIRGSDADGAAGSVKEINRFCKLFLDPVAKETMRLTTADLHDRPASRRYTSNLFDYSARGTISSELVKVLHDGTLNFQSSASPS
jgi:hypothetical protein